MDIFSKDELKTLVNYPEVGCVCVSLYMPTQRPGRVEILQNPTRLRNLLREAREKLEKIGLRPPEADAYLKPAERLLEDSYFWVNMSDGLAIFLAKDYFRYYRLPVSFSEMAEVASRFHVKPLLPLLATDGRFYVLAISQNTVRLLQCTRFGFHELNVDGKIPKSMGEALRFDHFDRETQYHAHLGVTSLGGTGGAMLTAHGEEVENTKENLERFFFMVDRGLQRELLHNETAPLVIVSVAYLFPIYQKANTYEHLLDKEASGSPDKMSDAELHRLGLTLVEPYFKKRQEELVRRYASLTGTKIATNDIKEVVTDAYQGRVYVLFVDAETQKWGTYDPFENKVEVHAEEKSCDLDLLDFAAAHTLAHRGEVYALKKDEFPSDAPVAAVLRY